MRDTPELLALNRDPHGIDVFGCLTQGAEISGRTVQYCMPLPSEVMSAAAYPAVTNARATGDYFHGSGDGGREQWALGGTSLFYWAIGILPFKDGYYSSTNKQVGGQVRDLTTWTTLPSMALITSDCGTTRSLGSKWP